MKTASISLEVFLIYQVLLFSPSARLCTLSARAVAEISVKCSKSPFWTFFGLMLSMYHLLYYQGFTFGEISFYMKVLSDERLNFGLKMVSASKVLCPCSSATN